MKEVAETKKETKQEAKEVKLTKAQIQAWKDEFGKVYKTTVNGEDYVWRKLKRREYVDIMSKGNDSDSVDAVIYHRQEEMAKAVVLYPTDIAERIQEHAGLATVLSDEIVLKSGFDITSETEEL